MQFRWIRIVVSLSLAAAIDAASLHAGDVAKSVPSFHVDVMSTLSKAGCNAGTCHGNLNGKGGFTLSLRGQDPWTDYRRLTQAVRGRRINLAAPEQSLILKKASGQLPHVGGVRFDETSSEFSDLVRWISAGAPQPDFDGKQLERMDVQPKSAVVFDPQSDLQITVTAHFADGERRDVSGRACYELSNHVARVDADGRVSRAKFGETTVIVRYLDQQFPVAIAFRESDSEFRWDAPGEQNFIDHHVFKKLRDQKIQPSPLAADEIFLRRAFLDAIGRLPTPQEARSFLQDSRSDKRRSLIDALLQRPEFADYWALKFADILRVEEKVLDPQGVEIFHGWIRDCITTGVPLDEMVRRLVTGTGNTFEHPEANFYRANRDPATRGETTARLFLGTRLQCAKCHNHPFDRWTQDEYYQWSNLFSQIDYELGENKRRDKLDKNEFAGEQTVLVSEQPEFKNPSTGEVAPPKFLGGPAWDPAEQEDRLQAAARWLTSPENELFVHSQVNFIWYHLMGKGLVDPVDDFRVTNPASNEPLLRALGRDFAESQFDLRHIVRVIMSSRTYQASSTPLPSNRSDGMNYSRAYVRRHAAEVLLDMQSDVLDSPAEFVGYAAGIRAIQVPGIEKVRRRDKRPAAGDRFLKTFGKPQRILACDCERSNETNLQQVLGLVGSELDARLANSPRLRRLAVAPESDEQVLTELYLAALTRQPTDEELQAGRALIKSLGREVALQDLTWALLNAKEFLFRR